MENQKTYLKKEKQIFIAFTSKFNQIISMIVFLTIIIYIYANYAYLFIRADYQLDLEGGVQQNVCQDLLFCTIFHFNNGIRSGGGIGDSLDLVSIHNLFDYFLRYIGDLLFFISVILLIINMINGIIITTFSQLREENEKLHNELDNKCYICGDSKDNFEERKADFSQHLLETHNYLNYIKFFCYLLNKPEIEYSNDEIYLYLLYKESNVKCLPIHSS